MGYQRALLLLNNFEISFRCWNEFRNTSLTVLVVVSNKNSLPIFLVIVMIQ